MGTRLAILASGNGSNLQAILDQVTRGALEVEVGVVISDKKDAFALERASRAGVEALLVPSKGFPTREAYDTELIRLLNERRIDWIVLAGFMRILSPLFVRAFQGKILNIHPSLLPKYPGVHSIERAFREREREVGVTVHFVDEGVDTGPIVLQEALPVKPGETLEALTERVHEVEHRVYPEAIRRVLSGKVTSGKP